MTPELRIVAYLVAWMWLVSALNKTNPAICYWAPTTLLCLWFYGFLLEALLFGRWWLPKD